MPRCIILISHLPPLVCCSKSHESTQFPPRLQSTLRRIRNSCLSGRLIRSIDLRLRRISEAVRADGRHRSPPPPPRLWCEVRRRALPPPSCDPSGFASPAGFLRACRRRGGLAESSWIRGGGMGLGVLRALARPLAIARRLSQMSALPLPQGSRGGLILKETAAVCRPVPFHFPWAASGVVAGSGFHSLTDTRFPKRRPGFAPRRKRASLRPPGDRPFSSLMHYLFLSVPHSLRH